MNDIPLYDTDILVWSEQWAAALRSLAEGVASGDPICYDEDVYAWAEQQAPCGASLATLQRGQPPHQSFGSGWY